MKPEVGGCPRTIEVRVLSITMRKNIANMPVKNKLVKEMLGKRLVTVGKIQSLIFWR